MFRLLLFASLEVLAADAGNVFASDIPKVWMSYHCGKHIEKEYQDIAAHGVDVIESNNNKEMIASTLRLCRKHHLKAFTSTDELSESSAYALKGAPYELAVMIGGAYRGLAIDRNLFAFTPSSHDIVIEPPVYSVRQPYVRGKKRSGHYFGDRVPVKAEVIVPLKPFDGEQHIKVIPCEMLPVENGAKPEKDTATKAMQDTDEIKNRRLVRIKFDLTPYADAMLDKVGIAVYWVSNENGSSWKKGRAHMSVFAESTRSNAVRSVRHRLQNWIDVNCGTFPADVLVGMRFGDECFNVTGWLDCPAASYPIYGYSQSGLAAFRKMAPGLEPPRTWGYPEIYGEHAYGAFLYNFHKGCAELARIVVETAHSVAPSIKVFRNTTRGGAWSYGNDHDGSGQELLARELDILHLDPYPVAVHYNASAIPFDMAYFKSLSRRYKKPLMPWLQAHRYAPSNLGHPAPEQIERMWKQHQPFNPDAIMWLGYGNSFDYTFPAGNSNAWARAGDVHREMKEKKVGGESRSRLEEDNNSSVQPSTSNLQPVKLAILRPYVMRALVCEMGNGKVRNPADAILAKVASIWSVERGLEYDVFEIPPFEKTEEKAKRDEELKKFEIVISSAPYGRALVVGEGTLGKVLDGSQISDAAHKVLKERVGGESRGRKRK